MKPSKTPKNDMTRQIGQAIARRRQACKLTQEDVAEKLNMRNEAVSRMERGLVTLTVERLIELAELFDCQVTELLAETSTRPTDRAQHLNRLLNKLNETDQIVVVEILEKLVNHMSDKS